MLLLEIGYLLSIAIGESGQVSWYVPFFHQPWFFTFFPTIGSHLFGTPAPRKPGSFISQAACCFLYDLMKTVQ